jgi:hypothetical protein
VTDVRIGRLATFVDHRVHLKCNLRWRIHIPAKSSFFFNIAQGKATSSPQP